MTCWALYKQNYSDLYGNSTLGERKILFAILTILTLWPWRLLLYCWSEIVLIGVEHCSDYSRGTDLLR